MTPHTARRDFELQGACVRAGVAPTAEPLVGIHGGAPCAGNIGRSRGGGLTRRRAAVVAQNTWAAGVLAAAGLAGRRVARGCWAAPADRKRHSNFSVLAKECHEVFIWLTRRSAELSRAIV